MSLEVSLKSVVRKSQVCRWDKLCEDCDSTGSRVPILPGTDSTGSYRVLLLYTTVGLSYRRSHLQRPLRS